MLSLNLVCVNRKQGARGKRQRKEDRDLLFGHYCNPQLHGFESAPLQKKTLFWIFCWVWAGHFDGRRNLFEKGPNGMNDYGG
jgi:hypothetical protein